MIVIHGFAELRKNHPVYYEELEKYIEEYEGAAMKFAMDAISDARQRENYGKNARRIVAEVRKQIESKSISVRDAAHYCRDMRNIIMAETRARTSPQGLLVAEMMKKDPKPMYELQEKYAQKKYNKPFDRLSPKEQNRVFYEIVQSAGRSNSYVNILNKTLIVMARVFIVYTVGHSIKSIAEAEDKKREAAKQVFSIGGGIVGASVGADIGAGGGPLVALVMAVVGGLLGGLLGDRFGEVVSDFLFNDEELEADNYAG